MRCRRRSAAMAGVRRARSSVSPIACCSSIAPSGRDFDDELVEQLELIPRFVAACGFVNARRAGYEADDFLAAAAVAEERRGGTVLVASGDRGTFQLASERTTILYPVKAGEM